MPNYQPSRGVRFTKYEGDNEEPSIDDSAEIEEIYFDIYNGDLCVSWMYGDEFYSISIPIVANSAWNEFVESLPKWNKQ